MRSGTLADMKRLDALVATWFMCSTACTGFISDPGADDTEGSGGSSSNASGIVNVAPSALRRMTPEQYENSVRDLFQVPALELELDEDTGDVVTRLAAEKINSAAEQIEQNQSSWGDPIFPCDTSGEGNDGCVAEFIDSFGKRAFRRPLDDEERAWLRGVYDKARTKNGFRDSLFVVLKVMLQSQQFIYFLEQGVEPGKGLAEGVRPLSSFERAARLSYFLWDSTPDPELMSAAESGELESKQGMRAQAERMLADPRARTTIVRFFSHWLELDGTTTHHSLDSAQKDGFTEDSPELRSAMRKEIEALVERVVLDGDGKLSTLFETRDAWVNGPLAELYGVAAPAGGGFGWVELPSNERAGILTRAAWNTVYAGPEVKSPIRRGAFLIERVLCVELGDPPPNANDTPVTGGAVEENGQTVHKTVREDVEQKTSGEGCINCHAAINPVGFAFDNYDALGRWHTEETGEDDSGPFALAIDNSGALPIVKDGKLTSEAQPIDGPIAMSSALASSEAVKSCFARRWFERAVGRETGEEDGASLDGLTSALIESNDVRELILALVVSDGFLHVKRLPD